MDGEPSPISEFFTTNFFYEGTAIELFESEHLREPYYKWNPPTRNILTIACDSDIDDSLELPDFGPQKNIVINSFDGENPLTDNDLTLTSDTSQSKNNNVIHSFDGEYPYITTLFSYLMQVRTKIMSLLVSSVEAIPTKMVSCIALLVTIGKL